MKKIISIISILLFLTLTQTANAQFGQTSGPSFYGEFKPVVGGWSEYQMTSKREGTTKMKVSIVGKEGDAYWYETEMEGGREGRTIMKMLVSGNPEDQKNIKRMIVKTGNEPAMEMPVEMMQQSSKGQGAAGPYSSQSASPWAAGNSSIVNMADPPHNVHPANAGPCPSDICGKMPHAGDRLHTRRHKERKEATETVDDRASEQRKDRFRNTTERQDETQCKWIRSYQEDQPDHGDVMNWSPSMEMVCPVQYSRKSWFPRAKRMELEVVWIDGVSIMNETNA